MKLLEVEVNYYYFILEHMKRVATLLVFPSNREKISRPGSKLPTTPFGFGYRSTIIR
jgi:hypothetical protein